ncbi:hypothetical protein M011DRAFT_522979 [Sporormia fimetaria CBS 119925]|uniref:Uncharacterized protein n=1 Tax=Sporormia fimetaria CBS 119925 TaxID=1340428 RepID=A0A6A6VSA1_9PLEO|nr:hypothetical protein M011DRAFT_522979 [Sporormia fimetaria CBS 119925]
MASRILVPAVRAASRVTAQQVARRGFQSSAAWRQEVVAPTTTAPVRKPVGAFRGGLFGFLLGVTSAAGGMYYYVVDEYRVSNELLTEDIYALQTAVQRIETYVKELEQRLDAKKR